jgi:hypothetical protein
MSDKVYDRVWKLLSDRSRWTKNCLARDCYGKPIFDPCHSPRAVSWCVIGAISKVYGWNTETLHSSKLHSSKYERLLDMVGDLVAWNNNRASHQELVSVLKEVDL